MVILIKLVKKMTITLPESSQAFADQAKGAGLANQPPTYLFSNNCILLKDYY